MNNNDQDQSVPADLLAAATKAPPKEEVMTEVNPFDRPPLLKVGKDFTPGMTITGWFSETAVIPTPKSKYSDTALTHILRIGSPTGKKLGIWSVAELKAFFEGMAPGTLVSLTCVSKGENSEGNAQYFFKFRRNGVQ